MKATKDQLNRYIGGNKAGYNARIEPYVIMMSHMNKLSNITLNCYRKVSSWNLLHHKLEETECTMQCTRLYKNSKKGYFQNILLLINYLKIKFNSIMYKEVS